MSAALGQETFNPADVQGNILRGYRYGRVRHVMLEVVDRRLARGWLSATVSGVDGVPAITTEEHWKVKPDSCFNIAFTVHGLRALGVSKASLRTFPDEFVEGMDAQAVKLGDTGTSAPDHWPAPFDDPAKIHMIASIHADDVEHLDRVEGLIPGSGEYQAFKILGARDGWNFNGDYVHFNYHDNISQPRFVGIHERDRFPDKQPLAPLGSMLMGYETEYDGLLWTIPQPDALGRNGSYNAFRVLAQDVEGFEAYLDQAADYLLTDPLADELLPPGDEEKIGPGMSRHAALREVVAAKMCGRWRNGVPLALSPDTPNPSKKVSLTDFDYTHGDGCPYGAHTRRANPRGGKIVQRAANHTRRVVRRGIPYGDPFDPAKPDGKERGLLGNFLCANLAAQFEALMCDWINLGLQDPRITGCNDPLLGANHPETSWFDIPLQSGAVIHLEGLPRLVHVRGGAYTFLPSISAIRYLTSLRG